MLIWLIVSIAANVLLLAFAAVCIVALVQCISDRREAVRRHQEALRELEIAGRHLRALREN